MNGGVITSSVGNWFSPDRRYRYTLWRRWPDDLFRNRTKPGYVQFVGLNPSTATETVDDPTLRLVQGYAKRWGYLELCMTNLFGYRATDPEEMKRQADPVGPDNDVALVNCARNAALVVACWGCHGEHLGRANVVLAELGTPVYALKLTGGGHPHHPLRLPKELQPKLWKGTQ